MTGSATEIELVQVSDTLVEGREGGAGGTLAFALSIDPDSGAVTVQQFAALDHPTPLASHDESVFLDGEVFVTATIEDGDEDTDSATSAVALNIEFQDDGPIGILPEIGVLVNAVGSSATFDLDADANIDNNVGADQLGSISFANITDGQTATGVIGGNTVNLTSGGHPIQLFLVDHDLDSATPDQLQGWTGDSIPGPRYSR